MKVFPIKSPLQGEQVVGVEPSMERFSQRDWRQRCLIANRQRTDDEHQRHDGRDAL